MSLNTADCDERVLQLITLTERLTRMMSREIEAFEAHRPKDALAGAEETARLANLYRHESLKLRKDPSLIAASTLSLRRKLIDATRLFDTALARHGRAVGAAKEITEGLVRAIAEEIAAQRAPAAGYGQGGLANVSKATAMTLNQRA
jgi:hypothetical protein